MARQQVITDTMREAAKLWLARSKSWTRGVRKRDGLAFVIFPSSRRDDADMPVGYYTRADGGGCTCRGYWYRGVCAHSLACKAEAEQARRNAATKAYDKYSELFPDNVDAF